MKDKNGETLRCTHCIDFETNDCIQRVHGEGNGKCKVRNEIVFCDKLAQPWCFERRTK